jgi:ATP/maltotriose-dependent transcriptional regulator MalT
LLFRHLSAFTGGFSLEAAASIFAMPEWNADGTSVMDVVASLIDHSLVRHAPAEAGEIRFGMLEVIRQFGLERLVAHGEESMARDAHAAWYLAMGVDAEHGLQDGDQVMWLDRLEAEHDNLRSVFTWLFEQKRIEDAVDLAVHVMFFRFIRGHRREFGAYLEALLEHPHLNRRTSARGKALLASGTVMLGLGDSAHAMETLGEALLIFREYGGRKYAATALGSMGLALMAQDDLDGATAVFEESVSLAREVKSARLMSAGISNLGLVAWRQGRTSDAEALQKEGLQIARDGADSCLIAQIIGDLGEMAFNRGDFDQAEPLFQESMNLIRALGDRRDLPHISVELAKIERIRGDYAAADAHLEEALAVAREIGDPFEVASSLLVLGTIASLRGQHLEALRAIRESIKTFRKLGAQSGIAECLDAFADVAVRTHDMTYAAQLIGAADASLQRVGIPRTEGLTLVEHQDRIAAVQSALGEETFDTAWSAGAALTLDEAVAEALAFNPSEDVQAPSMSDGAMGLSPREREVLQLMAEGLTNREIAGTLLLSPRTVASHAANILGKLGLASRTAAVAFAIRNGLA